MERRGLGDVLLEDKAEPFGVFKFFDLTGELIPQIGICYFVDQGFDFGHLAFSGTGLG